GFWAAGQPTPKRPPSRKRTFVGPRPMASADKTRRFRPEPSGVADATVAIARRLAASVRTTTAPAAMGGAAGTVTATVAVDEVALKGAPRGSSSVSVAVAGVRRPVTALSK